MFSKAPSLTFAGSKNCSRAGAAASDLGDFLGIFGICCARHPKNAAPVGIWLSESLRLGEIH